jgi:hypothetical protein
MNMWTGCYKHGAPTELTAFVTYGAVKVQDQFCIFGAAIPYAEGERHAHEAVSHLSFAAAFMVLVVCAVIMVCYFRKRR